MADSEIQKAVSASENYEEPIVETIKRLAELPSIEYERCRKEEAKRLSMRATALDREVKAARPKADDGNDLGLFDPEPWSEEVDGDDLLDRIVGVLRTYVVMPPHVAEATALWAVHCHCFDNWQHTPRLGITAPENFDIELHLPDDSPWKPLLPFEALRPDTYHRFTNLQDTGPVTHMLYMHYPNGGIHGLKLHGH